MSLQARNVMVKVAFTSTAYGPLWKPAVDSWMRVIGYTQRELIQSGKGTLGGIGLTDRSYTHSAQNQLVKDLLTDDSFTHLFMTEMDMILPDDCIMKLLEVNKPIVSGIYFLRNGNGQPCLYKKVVTTKDNPWPMSPVSIFPTKNPFLLNGNPGLGCVLIERSVFEKLKEPWFDLKEYTYGSDMYFFSKVGWDKIEVWAHPGVMCKQIDYTVVDQEDYYTRLKNDSKFAGSGYIIGTEEDLSAPLK